MVLDVVTLPARPHALHFDFQPCALVLVREERPDKARAVALLQTAFELTASEAAVALQVAAGRDLQSVARDRGVSYETVRNQLKSVFGKLGVHRQSELAARIAPFR